MIYLLVRSLWREPKLDLPPIVYVLGVLSVNAIAWLIIFWLLREIVW